jgi:hypothetical protein
MRVMGAVAVVMCVLFGVLGFSALLGLHSNVENARENAEQLVRIQTIRTSLVTADASATNAFLVGGLEPPAVRDAYGNGIATAARTLAEASAQQPDDAPALQRVNRVLTQYSGLIESARANNRQGFPIGTAYLRQASQVLRDDALPTLATLVQTEERRFDNSTDAAESARDGLVLLIVLALIVLLVPQVYLSRRTRRTFNKPLLGATAVIAVTGLIAFALVSLSSSKVDDARSNAFRDTVALANARINGFDAKSAEALTLIARGSGAAFQERFLVSANDAALALGGRQVGDTFFDPDPVSRAAFTDYVAQHEKLRELDDNGKHDDAVAVATGTGAANAAFARFDRASAEALGSAASELSDQLDDAAGLLVPMAWLVLVAGIGAAVLAWRGISQRLQEYR